MSLLELRSRSLVGEIPWEEQLFCRAGASLEHHLCALGQQGQDLWHILSSLQPKPLHGSTMPFKSHSLGSAWNRLPSGGRRLWQLFRVCLRCWGALFCWLFSAAPEQPHAWGCWAVWAVQAALAREGGSCGEGSARSCWQHSWDESCMDLVPFQACCNPAKPRLWGPSPAPPLYRTGG